MPANIKELKQMMWGMRDFLCFPWKAVCDQCQHENKDYSQAPTWVYSVYLRIMQTVLFFTPYNVSPSILIFSFCINKTMAICFLYSTVFYESEENVNTTANRWGPSPWSNALGLQHDKSLSWLSIRRSAFPQLAQRISQTGVYSWCHHKKSTGMKMYFYIQI